MPSGDEIAVLIENLDTTVATIGNVDASHRAADRNIVRVIEIARCRSFVTPGLDEAAILGEFDDAAVIRDIAAVAIGNKNIAICRDRHRLCEWAEADQPRRDDVGSGAEVVHSVPAETI